MSVKSISEPRLGQHLASWEQNDSLNKLPKPKLINTTPSLYKNNKTIHIISNSETKPSAVFSNIYVETKKNILDHSFKDIILLLNIDECDVSKSYDSNVLITTDEIYKKINYRSNQQCILLDEINKYFQFFNQPWNGTLADAIGIYAIVTHMNRIFIDFDVKRFFDDISPDRRDLLESLSIKISSEYLEEKIWLFTQFYIPKINSRYQEILDTLEYNLKNPLIERIVLFCENNQDMDKFTKKYQNQTKIKLISLGKRLTYSDFLKYVGTDQVPPDTFVILANSDIYFDETLEFLWQIKLDDVCLALLRWEHNENKANAKIFGIVPYSQDSWIFNSNSIKSRANDTWNQQTYEKFNYSLGIPGCDNSFTTDIFQEKFMVVNPAGSIKSYHIHASQVRTYSNKDTIYRPIYFGIFPTIINEKKIEKNFSTKYIGEFPCSTEITIKSNNDARATTYVKMLARSNRYIWTPPPHCNQYSDTFKIYSFLEKQFVNNLGIIFNFKNIYLSDECVNKNFFKNISISLYSQFIKVPNFLSIPISSNEIINNLNSFLYYYAVPLIRCIHEIKENTDIQEIYVFWPEKYLSMFNNLKPELDLKIIPWNNLNIYSEKIYYYPPKRFEPSYEHIDIFRKSLKNYSFFETEKRLIYYVNNNSVIDLDLSEKLRPVLQDLGYTLEVYDSDNLPNYSVFCGASGIIFWGEPNDSERWYNLWALPQKAAMLEFQNEFKLDGEAQIMGSACKLDTRIFILQKAEIAYLQELALTYISDYFKMNRTINE